MPRLSTRILLFLSSYAPLFGILAFKAHPDSMWLVYGLAAVAIVSPIGLLLYVTQWLPSKAEITITAKEVTPMDGEAVSYFVFYLFPFLDVSLNSFTKAAPMVILLIVMLIIYVNSNMMYVNPMLNLFGFHFFEVENENGKVYGLIARDHYIRPDTSFLIHPTKNYVALKKE
ncbi:hypothetical protein [Salinibacter sp.]|uniref:hypothetical protein n=1 Tax=Salinibacter sp. TaxID=2065818 RepID=UPI0021E857EC|nr:hypothetical protein [Salinibacter sp.]